MALDYKDCLKKWNDSPDVVMVSDNNKSRGFDCNICLDSVHDPVVTLCGHLYCWPCIYKWLHAQTISTEDQNPKQHQCPVCKAEVSDTKLIPLYGRGVSTKESRAKASQSDMDVPKRPLGPTCDVGTIQRSSNTIDNQHFRHYGYSYEPDSMLSPGGTGTTINVPDPLIRMFGEMVYTRVFGNSVTDLYTYPNSYNLAGITSPRIRRHVMQADKSLGRICFFLCCCVFLCLVLF